MQFPQLSSLCSGIKGGREIAKSKPLSMIFTILTHCMNKTEIDNYFARTQGRWFGLGKMLKGSAPPRGPSR